MFLPSQPACPACLTLMSCLPSGCRAASRRSVCLTHTDSRTRLTHSLFSCEFQVDKATVSIETENVTTRVPVTCPPHPEALAGVINQTPWTNKKVQATAASGSLDRFAPPSGRDVHESMRNETPTPKRRVLVPVQAYQASFVVKVRVSAAPFLPQRAFPPRGPHCTQQLPTGAHCAWMLYCRIIYPKQTLYDAGITCRLYLYILTLPQNPGCQLGPCRYVVVAPVREVLDRPRPRGHWSRGTDAGASRSGKQFGMEEEANQPSRSSK